MDLDLLRAFVTTARSTSLTEASRRLGLSQSGMSRRLSRLEGLLGTTLLDRDRAGVAVTADGEVVLRFAERVLAGEEELQLQLAARHRDLSGALRVSASTVPAEQILPRLLAPFLRRHPWVSVQVDVTDTDGVIEQVAARRADLGFSGDTRETVDLVFHPVVQDVVVVALPANHPLAGRSALRPEELADERHILREPGSGTHRTVYAALARAGIRWPTPPTTLTVGSTQALLSAVRAGLGVGFVSILALEHQTGVVGARLADIDTGRGLYLVHEPRRPRPAAVQAFLQHVRDGVRGLHDGISDLHDGVDYDDHRRPAQAPAG